MTGESDRKMTSVCLGSEESKGYEEKIRKERRGTLDGRQLVWNIMMWFAGFSEEKEAIRDPNPDRQNESLKFRT
jgi:hypothetical protein